MKRVLLATVLAFAATTTLAAHQKSHAGHSRKAAKHESGASDTRVAVNVHFSIGEQRVIREYYAPRHRSLPRGLQKKVARGGQLPPGWQKKLQPFPFELERQLAPLPAHYGRGVIDGHAVIYSTRSQAVVDVAVLF